MRINAIECFVDWANKSNQIKLYSTLVSIFVLNTRMYAIEHCYLIDDEWIIACVVWVKIHNNRWHISLKAPLVFGTAWVVVYNFHSFVSLFRHIQIIRCNPMFNIVDSNYFERIEKCNFSNTFLDKINGKCFASEWSGRHTFIHTKLLYCVLFFFSFFWFWVFFFSHSCENCFSFCFWSAACHVCSFVYLVFIVLKTKLVVLIFSSNGLCSLNWLNSRGQHSVK